jgi:4-hydroxy-tetrahydrodipicolinate reductase
MGRAVAQSIEQHSAFALVGTWKRGGDIDTLVAAADVVVDFSMPDGTELVVDAAVKYKKPLVCGVSGLGDRQMAKLDAASGEIPIVFDRNMSMGIAVLERTVRDAAASLGLDYAVTISETHHVHKKDAPSGTALKLGDAILEARGESGTGQIQFEVERRGEVPGDHEVVMSTATERLSFAHSVTTRQVFADGALRAAQWLIDQPPGLYSMQDVLFARGSSNQ